jgi:hypothetical protein
MPMPSPSGSGLSLPELSRTTLRDDSAITKPKYVFLDEEMFRTRFRRARPTNTPAKNSRTEPSRTVTPSWPSLTTPVSQNSPRRQRLTGSPSPATVWPFRLRVMSSAPITMPLLGQPVRSLSSVVSAVIVSPQRTWLAGEGPPPSAIAPVAANAANVASETSIAGAVRGRSFAGIRSIPFVAGLR